MTFFPRKKPVGSRPVGCAHDIPFVDFCRTTVGNLCPTTGMPDGKRDKGFVPNLKLLVITSIISLEAHSSTTDVIIATMCTYIRVYI